MYFSMHNHTDYSNLRLIDSINTVEDLIDKAVEYKLKGLAITDHEALGSHIKALKHVKKLKKENPELDFKLALGNEIYLVRNGLTKDNYNKNDFYHFILIAKDAIGHKQLRELSTRAWNKSFLHYVERVPTYYSDIEEVIGKNPGHVIATTACLGGFLGYRILNLAGKTEQEQIAVKKEISNYIAWCKNIFGEDFYLEIQPSIMKDQHYYNEMLVKLASKYQVKLIAATDTHYLTPGDRKIHEAYLKSKDGEREVADFYSSTFMMKYEEALSMLMASITKEEADLALYNTLGALGKVQEYDLSHAQVVPKIPLLPIAEAYLPTMQMDIYPYLLNFLNSGNEYDRYYAQLILKGLHIKIPKDKHPKYYSRINQELKEVWEISEKIHERLSSYFVTTAKVIEIMWNEGDSLVGVSRGSAAGFVTNYLIDIIQIDPLKMDIELPHWRFVHADRPELADIDIDSQGSKREQILHAVRKYFVKHGGDVVNVCTYGTEGSKSAIQTACRGLGYDNDIGLYISSLIPSDRGTVRTLKDCYFGNEEENWNPIKQFINEINRYPNLWDVASKIEGLIKQRGIHASGILITNSAMTDFNAVMRAPSGALLSQYELYDSEYMGGIKIDMLTVEALDKIRVTMDLLLEFGLMERQNSLKETYDKYLHPDVLDYTNEKMWQMVANNEVLDLFQFDTPVGLEAAKKIRPKNLLELAQANSLMRLMTDGGEEMPVETFIKYKNNINQWYSDMRQFGLTEDEIDILKQQLGKLHGVADSQESIMLLVMDPKIANFSVAEANKLRKGIARKKKEILAEVRELLYTKGLSIGTSIIMLNYVWNVLIHRQIGYSFSLLHTAGYSLIALQQLNLVHKYPPIFWNTACLTVNAGAIKEENEWDDIEDININIVDTDDSSDDDDDDEEEPVKEKSAKVKPTDYGKIASAIGKIQSRNIKIALPNINLAKFSFVPDVQKDQIIFGLKGITRVSDVMVEKIIENRPYKSLDDFIKRVKPSKLQIVNLIKAGTFDEVQKEHRAEIMRQYIESIYGEKKRITLQNMNGLIEHGLVPAEHALEIRIYNLNKYLKQYKKGAHFILTPKAQEFYNDNFNVDLLEYQDGEVLINQKTWDRIYQKAMDPIRAWMKKNIDEVLKSYNKKLFTLEWEKYCLGTLSQWEMDSLSFYYHKHELQDMKYEDLNNFFSLPEIPIVTNTTMYEGRVFPRYQLTQIAGTVLDRNKIRHTVSLLTPNGVVIVKLYRAQFAKYDAQISKKDPTTGKKTIIEKSWFKRGNKLIFTGFRRGDQFIVKTYKKHHYDTAITMISDLDDENRPIVITERSM